MKLRNKQIQLRIGTVTDNCPTYVAALEMYYYDSPVVMDEFNERLRNQILSGFDNGHDENKALDQVIIKACDVYRVGMYFRFEKYTHLGY
jgi:hypothetical protein